MSPHVPPPFLGKTERPRPWKNQSVKTTESENVENQTESEISENQTESETLEK